MQKLKHVLPFKYLPFPSLSQNHLSNMLISLITNSFSHNRACSSIPDPKSKNSVLANYLISSLKFPEKRAVYISSTFSGTQSLKKPEEVVRFFNGAGFSDAQIQSITHGFPKVLFAHAEKTLKPKLIFLQELGLSGPCISTLFSEHPAVLTCCLDRTLKPCISLFKKVLENDGKHRSKEQVSDCLFQILRASNRVVASRCLVEANIIYLKSCGVVGSQLSLLLLRQTRLLTVPKKILEALVSRAVDMNFPTGSRMLAHAIRVLYCSNAKILDGKYEVFRMFGFSEGEIASVFRSSPMIFTLSEANLRRKMEFFIDNIKISKLVVVRYPSLMSFSLEGRVIPRIKVLEMLKSRGYIEELNIPSVMYMKNQQFMEKFVLPFQSDAEELMLAYEGKFVDTS